MYPPLLPSQLIWNIFCLFYRCVFVLSISWAFNRHSALLQSDGSIMLAWSLNTHVSKSLSNPRACMWPHRFHTRLCSYLQSTPELLPHHTQLHFHVFFSTSVCVLPCPLCSSSKGTGTAVRVWGQTFSRSAAILCCQRLSESGHPRPAHQRKCLSDQDISLLKVAHSIRFQSQNQGQKLTGTWGKNVLKMPEKFKIRGQKMPLHSLTKSIYVAIKVKCEHP